MTEQRRPRGRPREDKAEIKTNQSLERALGLLRVLSEHDGMTLTELAEAAGLPPSTAHRLLATLAAHGMVVADETRQTWAIGLEALRIGMAFQRRSKLLTASRAEMQALMEATGETVNLALLDRFDVVFVSQVECAEPIRAFFRIGERRSGHASGIGKALLAQLPAERLEAHLRMRPLARLTPATITDPAQLHAELAAIRARGWSLDDEEASSGMRCVAAAIFNEFGEAFAGISLSGPSARLTPDRLEGLGTRVSEAARAITRRIGGHILG